MNPEGKYGADPGTNIRPQATRGVPPTGGGGQKSPRACGRSGLLKGAWVLRVYVGGGKACGSPKGSGACGVCTLESLRHGQGDAMAPRAAGPKAEHGPSGCVLKAVGNPGTLRGCAGHSTVAAGWAGNGAPRPLRARTLTLTRTTLAGRSGRPSLVSRPPPSAGPLLAPSLRCPCRPPPPKPQPPT